MSGYQVETFVSRQERKNGLKRVRTHVEISAKAILLKLFLDLVFSFSTDDVTKYVSCMFF